MITILALRTYYYYYYYILSFHYHSRCSFLSRRLLYNLVCIYRISLDFDTLVFLGVPLFSNDQTKSPNTGICNMQTWPWYLYVWFTVYHCIPNLDRFHGNLSLTRPCHFAPAHLFNRFSYPHFVIWFVFKRLCRQSLCRDVSVCFVLSSDWRLMWAFSRPRARGDNGAALRWRL